jgi:hypothetical protein
MSLTFEIFGADERRGKILKALCSGAPTNNSTRELNFHNLWHTATRREDAMRVLTAYLGIFFLTKTILL